MKNKKVIPGYLGGKRKEVDSFLTTIKKFFKKISTTIFLIVALITITNNSHADEYDNQLDCLAEAIYFEARGEYFAGMLAVATVIMNRVSHQDFPNHICAVVHEGKYWEGNPIKNQCQFSYYCDGKSENLDNPYAADLAYQVAEFTLDGARLKHLEDALYYHANYVNPNWPYKKIMVIGRHIFYGEDDG